MLSEQDIALCASPRTLRRARNIVAERGSLFERSCVRLPAAHEGDAGRCRLRARVSAEQGHAQAEDVVLELDAEAESVLGYNCTCAAFLGTEGMCKHVAAVALSFAAEPDAFHGFVPGAAPASSANVAALLAPRKRDVTCAPAEHDHDIAVALVFVLRCGTWHVRVRIVAPQGRFAARDLSAFAHALESGAVEGYGQRLSFAHVASAFAPEALGAVRAIARCVSTREHLQRTQAGVRISRPDALRGELALSVPELVELLEASRGLELAVEQADVPGAAPKRTRIVEGNPPVHVAFAEAGDGGFTLRRDEELLVMRHLDACYAYLDGLFYACDARFLACERFFSLVYCDRRVEPYLSPHDAPAFCTDVLPALEACCRVDVPPALAALRPARCRIEVYLDYVHGACTCTARACYEDASFDVLAGEEGTPAAGMRDERAERRVRDMLLEALEPATRATTGGACVVSTADEHAIAGLLFGGLAALSSVADVFTTSTFDALLSRRRVHVDVGLSVSHGLIGLTLSSAQVAGADIAGVLSAYREHRSYHRLKDGTFLDMEGQDLASLDTLLDAVCAEPEALDDGSLELAPYRALQLDVLCEHAQRTAAFDALVRTAAGEDAACAEVPATFRGTLRPYQREGFAWLCALADARLAGVLADEMGLGKTVQAIAFLLRQHERATRPATSLVVCPASLVYNWTAEFARFAPQLAVTAVAGERCRREELLEAQAGAREGAADVLVTSYDLLKRDIDAYAPLAFSCVVLDEAHYIKNAGTQASRAVKALSCTWRLALTGTPVENRPSELWSLFDFLMPGYLGTYAHFRESFELPICQGDTSRLEALHALTARFVLRRLKADVLDDVPDKSVSIVYAKLTGAQRRLYDAKEDELRAAYRTRPGTDGKARMDVLADIMRLRELACDPRLVYEGYDGPSAKLDTIVELVLSAREAGSKVLVFSQFTRYLALIAARFDAAGVSYCTIVGATPKRERVELAEAFNADATQAMLVSLKAGGTGLNLTGATVVIHADPWWNAAAEAQASDRTHRIGQTRDVSVYKVIAADTIEERVLALQREKSHISAMLLAGDGQSACEPLGYDDMLALLDT